MKSIVFFIAIIIFLSPLALSIQPSTNTQSYEWDFLGQSFRMNVVMGNEGSINVARIGNNWIINLSIPSMAYSFYREYPGGYRIGDNFSYLNYFVTPNDVYIKELANTLDNISGINGWDELTEANFILTFVQNIPYVSDYPSTGFMDYYKFPLETLIEGGGDCEDKSILLATILDILGYNSILFAMEVEYKGLYGHVAVGLDVEKKEGPFSVYLQDYYIYDGKKYYYMESTGEESIYLDLGEIKTLRYWVGISPQRAGIIIKNLTFIPIEGQHYAGYGGNSEYVEENVSSDDNSWVLLYLLILNLLYFLLFFIFLAREKKKCPSCGYTLEKDFEYCPNCGYWINPKIKSFEIINEKK